MTSYTLEDKVREKRDGRGVNDLKPRQPFGSLPFPAVRGKFVPVGSTQIPVGCLENTFRSSCVSIGESTATRDHVNTQVGKLTSFWKHGFSNLSQGIEAFDHGIEHDDKMLPGIKVLNIPFATVFTTEFDDFDLSSKEIS